MAWGDAKSAKLQKVESFRRKCPHVTASALAAIVSEIHQHGIPDLAGNRNRLKEATQKIVNEETPYGKLLITVDVVSKKDESKTLPLLCINPLALLHKSIEADGGFAKFFYQRLRLSPSSPEAPWSLILYSDEIVPGNALSSDNKRKVWGVYFSFMEFGMHFTFLSYLLFLFPFLVRLSILLGVFF